MFIFDATTIAILLPSTILWALIITVNTHKKVSYSLSHHINFPDLLQRRKTKNILGLIQPTQNVQVQMRIYGLCVTLSGILYCALNFLNPLKIPFGFATDTFILTLLSLVGHLAVSILITLLLFYALQIEFSKRFLRNSNLELSKLEHIFFFCIIALYFVPIFEALLASIGFSSLPFWLAKDIFRVAVALSSFPLSMWGMVIAFKPIFWGREFKGIKSDQILSHVEFLKDKNFDQTKLVYKSDDEINCIIQIAKQLVAYDKAEIASESLLHRYLIESEAQA